MKQGSKAWNAWRSEHADDFIDFRKANLSWVHPDQIDASTRSVSDDQVYQCLVAAETIHGPMAEMLRTVEPAVRPNFAGAWLAHADLTECQLMGAYLAGSDLRYADLSNAKLRWVDLSSAALWSANLSEADLIASLLQNANLSEANLARRRPTRLEPISGGPPVGELTWRRPESE